MKVKLSLLRPGNELVDLVITAEPTSPISELARELHNAVPNRTGPAIAEGPTALVAPDGQFLALATDDAGVARYSAVFA